MLQQLVPLIGRRRGLRVRTKPDRLPPHPAGDDVLEPHKGPAADEQDIGRVHLDVLLLGVLAAPLGRDVGDGPFEHFQQGLLHPFARHVAGDRDVLAGLANLVDLVDEQDAPLGLLDVEVGGVQQLEQQVLDVLTHVARFGEGGRVANGERDLQGPGQGAGEQGLPRACRTNQQDVRLLDFDVVFGVGSEHEPLVVVVHRNCEHLLGLLLPDHVIVELRDNLAGGRNLVEEGPRRAPPALLLVENRLAKLNAFPTDVHIARSFDERSDIAVAFAAERTIGVLLASGGSVSGAEVFSGGHQCSRASNNASRDGDNFSTYTLRQTAFHRPGKAGGVETHPALWPTAWVRPAAVPPVYQVCPSSPDRVSVTVGSTGRAGLAGGWAAGNGWLGGGLVPVTARAIRPLMFRNSSSLI